MCVLSLLNYVCVCVRWSVWLYNHIWDDNYHLYATIDLNKFHILEYVLSCITCCTKLQAVHLPVHVSGILPKKLDTFCLKILLFFFAIFKQISLLFLVAVCNAAPQQSQAQQQFNYQNYLSSQTTTTPAPIHPPASIHYVNIGQELNGDYKFGYDTGKGPSGQSFREETRYFY